MKLSVPEPCSGLSISDIVAKTTSLARNLCLKPKQTLKVWTRTSFMLQRDKRRGAVCMCPRRPALGQLAGRHPPPAPAPTDSHGMALLAREQAGQEARTPALQQGC